MEIQAHRGASGYVFENTIASFGEAFLQGADSVELDVHLSNDNEVIVNHDYEIVDLRTNASEKKLIRNLYSDQINEISVLSESLKGIRLYPTLREVFIWFTHYLSVTSPECILDIEIKADKKLSKGGVPLLDAVMTLVMDFNISKNIRIRSFYPYVLNHLKKKYPQIHRILLTSKKIKYWVLIARFLRVNSVAPHISKVNLNRIKRARRIGLNVMVWTANKPEEFNTLIDWDVDAITTDFPNKLKDHLEGLNKKSSPLFL